MVMPAAKREKKTVTCFICKEKKRARDAQLFEAIRPGVSELVLAKYPGITPNDYICRDDLKIFRQQYVENVLEAEKGELSKLDHEVIKSMINYETLARNISAQFNQKLTPGQKIADKVAEFGGSWKFIITFFIVLVAWIMVNSAYAILKPFDPFPFILLNLVLSCLAAIQAPVILMSQNRRELKDRLRAENDYKVNLKAELQIRNLNEKIDYLSQQQWQRLLEIQKLQLELLEERRERKSRR